MTAKAQNFEIRSGDSAQLVFSLTDEAGSPLDPSGASFVWGLAATIAGPLLVQKASPADVTVNVAAKTATVAIAPEDTAALAGAYVHELQMTDAAGDVSTLAVGYATIKPDLIA